MHHPTRTAANVFRLWSVTACVMVILMGTSGHWFFLQNMAWARMIVIYAQQDSLYSAMAKTFDGRHPCALCLQVRQGQQEEKQKSGNLPLEKAGKGPELFCNACSTALPSSSEADVDLPAIPLDRYSDFVESPPTPPPRIILSVL